MIKLQDNAIAHIQRSLTKRGKGLGIRIAVKTTGCSGLAYVLEYADIENEHDVVIKVQDHEWKVFIDPKAIPYVNGMSIDFVKEGLQSGYKFMNPNEKDRCGCGESFRV